MVLLGALALLCVVLSVAAPNFLTAGNLRNVLWQVTAIGRENIWALQRRVAVDGRRVRVGWFRQMDGHTIGVTRASQDRVILLVVPSQATAAGAQIAMAMAAEYPERVSSITLIGSTALVPSSAATGCSTRSRP